MTDQQGVGQRVEGDWACPMVVGISGASGSGKSWLARQVALWAPDQVSVFDLDNYYRPADEVALLDCRYDNPAAIDFETALADFDALMSGRVITLPTYDYRSHAVIGQRYCEPKPLIVVEGIFVFADLRLRERMDWRVWVSAPEELLLERRLLRDRRERGRSEASVREQYEQEVLPGYRRYIEPLVMYADVVFANDGGSVLPVDG